MNDRSYTKLFSTIITSSLWCEDSDTRVVWVTLLALSNAHGEILASMPGLSRTANVPLDTCRKAMNKFESPDIESRTPAFDGRRIERIEGGWKLLNFEKYREMMTEEEKKEYHRNYYLKKKSNQNSNNFQEIQTFQENSSFSRQAEAEAEAEAYKEKIYSSTETGKNSKEEEVLTYLNQKAGTSYRPAQGSLKHISARLKEGATVEECCKVIDIKVQEWKNDPKMSKYLRPQTLFNSEKFHSYNGQTHIIKKPSQSWDSSEPFVASNI